MLIIPAPKPAHAWSRASVGKNDGGAAVDDGVDAIGLFRLLLGIGIGDGLRLLEPFGGDDTTKGGRKLRRKTKRKTS